MTGWITDADMIRDALNKHGSLSRADLVEKTNLERAVIAKSLYALKKQGDVVEEGDRLVLTKGVESAQDESEDANLGYPTTLPEECVTEPLRPEPDTAYPDTNQIIEDVAHLARAYWQANEELHRLQTEYASLIADRKAYHALMAALRNVIEIADD